MNNRVFLYRKQPVGVQCEDVSAAGRVVGHSGHGAGWESTR